MSPTGWIGKPVKRVEDARLLTGRGTYIDDHPPVAGLHHAAIVRSPHAHARILGYDLEAALAVRGVEGAIEGEDVLRLTKPFSTGVAAPAHGARARRAREQASLHRATRHRRLVWDQDVDLPLHRTDRVDGAADGCLGQVDRGPPGASARLLERHRPDRGPRARRQEGRN